ncbi:MAG: preprotein translocase subunit YajC [Nocardioidaceae bacterium]
MSPDAQFQLLFIVLMIVLVYVLVIRPARRRARQVESLQASLQVGDEVMLTSGIFGSITRLDGDRAEVTVSDGVVLTVHRGAIGEIVRDVAGPVDGTTDADAAQADPDSTNTGAN